MKNTPNAIRSATAFGCSPEQARRLFARNAAALSQMAKKAEKGKQKVNGYSASYLRAAAHAYGSA